MTEGAPPGRASAGLAYLSGAAGVITTRALGLAAGVLSLWLLTRILETEAFAGYTAAMSVLMLLGFAAGFGIERMMLLKIAGLPAGPMPLQGGRMMRRVAGLILLTGVIVGLGAAILWRFIPHAPGDAPVAAWLLWLWPVVPAVALTLALVTWYQANHQFGWPQAIWGVSDTCRAAGFLAVFILGLGAPWVAVSAVLAAVLPVTLLSYRSRGRTADEPGDMSIRDLGDGIQFFLMRFSNMAMTHLDILVLGLLAPASSVAQYVVASRFAAILETGSHVFLPAYAARARRHIAEGTPALAWREYGTARSLGLLITLPLIGIFVLFSADLLSFFGEFGTAHASFLILICGHLLNVGFGSHSIHMSMTDDLPYATANRCAALAAFAILLAVLVPAYGDEGAALSFAAASLVYNLAGAVLLKWRQGLHLLEPKLVAILAVTLAVLAGAAANRDIAAPGALVVFGLALALIFAERRRLRGILSELRMIVAR